MRENDVFIAAKELFDLNKPLSQIAINAKETETLLFTKPIAEFFKLYDLEGIAGNAIDCVIAALEKAIIGLHHFNEHDSVVLDVKRSDWFAAAMSIVSLVKLIFDKADNHSDAKSEFNFHFDCIARILNFLFEKSREKNSDATFVALHLLTAVNKITGIYNKLIFSREFRDGLAGQLLLASSRLDYNKNQNKPELYLKNLTASSTTLIGLIIDTHFGFTTIGDTDTRKEIANQIAKLSRRKMRVIISSDDFEEMRLNPQSFVPQVRKGNRKEQEVGQLLTEEELRMI